VKQVNFLDVGLNIAKESGKLLLERIDTSYTVDTKDSEYDLVTEMDNETEERIKSEILANFPNHRVFGEESIYYEKNNIYKEVMNGPYVWILDPIDGTANYVHQLPGYTISIAMISYGKIKLGIVYNPANDEMFWAEKGKGAFLNGKKINVSSRATLSQSILATGFPTDIENARSVVLKEITKLGPHCRNIRVFGSAALHCAYVAAGRIEAYWEPGLNLWDIAAGTLLVDEAGGKISKMDGSEFAFDFNDYLCTNGKINKELIGYFK
jgi:myo-inositol-1(or 4)-monophosphatase